MTEVELICKEWETGLYNHCSLARKLNSNRERVRYTLKSKGYKSKSISNSVRKYNKYKEIFK